MWVVASLAVGGQALADEAHETAPISFINQYCTDCHNQQDRTAGLALDLLNVDDLGQHTEIWEKVARKLSARQMPPMDGVRPDESAYNSFLSYLETSLDAVAAQHPDPGRTSTFRRLNRTEYQNAIRDLLALDVDVKSLLPADDSAHGFDNVTVDNLSPTLLSRYITAAQEISRLAVGRSSRPGGDTIRVRPDLTQEAHVDGLPIGTRGGVLFRYTFPQDGEYDFQVRLARDRNEEVEGLSEPHEIEILLDRERVALFTIKPPREAKDHATVDSHLKARIHVTPGSHQVGVTFPMESLSLLETMRQPLNAHFNTHRHPRINPAVYQVSIFGPFSATGPGDTASRRRIFVCRPARVEEEEACAERILSTLMRRAFRRPVTDRDLSGPMEFYRQGRIDGDFDAGIEMALSSVLVSPQFLFRIELDPRGIAPNAIYRVNDVDLASRLSFFLWSSSPDDELLDLAIEGQLSRPAVLEQQVRRMLADDRSQALVKNFAEQWLYLRNLESITPDARLFPDFDDNLRQAFRKETELFFESIVAEDRSVLDLLNADYTFVNERLAKHYNIPGVYGSRFRRVSLDTDSVRGGLLRHGSVLTVTSYATRTSPVIRGQWILKNILGMPPPPPPANVPALKDNTVSANLSVRERLAEHRADAACATCHDLIDPVGFALENFDAVGRWRDFEAGKPVDATGGLPDGTPVNGVSGLEQGILQRPELFVRTLVEKLLTFALGRGIEFYDAPAVRRIVRDARSDNYRFSSLVVGIANSTPFLMRKSDQDASAFHTPASE
jgi:hypothetical protein